MQAGIDVVLLSLIDKYGLPIVTVVVLGYFIWYILTKVVIPAYQETRKAELASADSYRTTILAELLELKKESRNREDKVMELWSKQIDANIKQALSNSDLSDALGKITSQLEQHSEKIEGLSRDMRNVYTIVGQSKRLLD